MTITKEQIENERAGLLQRREQLLVEFHHTNGAIAACDAFLSMVEQNAAKDAEAAQPQAAEQGS